VLAAHRAPVTTPPFGACGARGALAPAVLIEGQEVTMLQLLRYAVFGAAMTAALVVASTAALA
jgi:hypothetical protein